MRTRNIVLYAVHTVQSRWVYFNTVSFTVQSILMPIFTGHTTLSRDGGKKPEKKKKKMLENEGKKK